MSADLGAAKAALEAYVATRPGVVATHSIAIRAAGTIDKGHVSRGLELFDVSVGHADGTSTSLQVVRKHTGANEVLALRALQRVSDASGLPVLIADGRDAAGRWVLLPFYAGPNPPGRLAVPAAVFDVLAHVHARYQHRGNELDGIITIDTRWWNDLCRRVILPILDEALARGRSELRAARDAVLEAATDPRFGRALERLPMTLLHGDMHDGNVIDGPEGIRIVDWGNARVGPAMVDIANIAEYGSASFQRYLAAWSSTTGHEIDPYVVDLGYRFGTVVVNTQYVGFAVQHGSAGEVYAMTAARRDALEALGQLLGRSC
jgi:hypothetical protein